MKTRIFAGIFLFVLSAISVSVTAQKGNIKIYSELKGIEIYLDEEFKGVDITTIDSVPSGSHYLKINQENVTIYGEIININPGGSTAILIKDTKEIQDKISAARQAEKDKFLAGKSSEIATYKEQKVGVKTHTRVITETTMATQSKYNSYYHSSSGTSNSVSETKEIEEWWLVQGETPINDEQFARLINDNEKINEVTAYNTSIKPKRSTKGIFGTICTGIGLFAGVQFILALATENRFAGVPLIIYLAGFTTGIMLFTTIPGYHNVSYSKEEAQKKAALYNQNLKRQLGLPEDWEPSE